MRQLVLFIAITLFTAVVCTTACKHKPDVTVAANDGNFPDSIANIFVSKCATAGCHNQASYVNAGDLLLDSWAHLFNGGISGAVAIAYSTAYSPLLYYVNRDSTLGTIVKDPPHDTLLSIAEYKTLSNWMANGAPDKSGNIPFASNPDTRQKIYLTNQGCSVVAVIDAQSKLVMRYIQVGDNQLIRAPHDVEVSSDGAYAYVPMFEGNKIEKIDTRTDAIINTLDLSSYTLGGADGQWSIIHLSPQDTAFMVSGFLPSGYVVTVNTGTMQVNQKKSVDAKNFPTNTTFATPHGITCNPTFDTFFSALQYGNEVIKFWFKPAFGYKYISVNGAATTATNAADSVNPNPHQIIMAPDNSRYFVSCQQTGKVSVIDAHTDSLIAQIQVGFYPQEMTISKSKHYLFVACMEDHDNPLYQMLGSVYVIDYNTLQIVNKIYGDFYEPHDVAVDEQDGLIYIANRNFDNGGIPAHHSTVCGGNAGWYNVYNLNTLTPADNKRYEVTNDAYALATRFQ